MKTITTFNELVESIKSDKITMLDNNRYFDMIPIMKEKKVWQK